MLVLAVGPDGFALGRGPAGRGGAWVVRGAALGQHHPFGVRLTLFGVLVPFIYLFIFYLIVCLFIYLFIY